MRIWHELIYMTDDTLFTLLTSDGRTAVALHITITSASLNRINMIFITSLQRKKIKKNVIMIMHYDGIFKKFSVSSVTVQYRAWDLLATNIYGMHMYNTMKKCVDY